MRLRSRSGVSGSRQSRGKSVARARICCLALFDRAAVRSAWLAAARILLGLGQRAELVIPVGFQGIGDETVVGIDLQEALLGQVGLIACPLDLLLPQVDRLRPVAVCSSC